MYPEFGPARSAAPLDPYTGERIRVRGITGPGALLLFVAFAVSGMLLYYAQFSGAVRWLLALIVVSTLAGFAWHHVSRHVGTLPPLVRPHASGPERSGDLASMAAAIRRADGGLLYSQVHVTTRARSAFLERARLSLGLSVESMRDLQRDRAALLDALKDEVLADFLYLRSHDLQERSRWVFRAREADGFRARFEAVLARMEAWR